MLDLLLCMNEARSVAGTLEALLRAIKNRLSGRVSEWVAGQMCAA